MILGRIRDLHHFQRRLIGQTPEIINAGSSIKIDDVIFDFLIPGLRRSFLIHKAAAILTDKNRKHIRELARAVFHFAQIDLNLIKILNAGAHRGRHDEAIAGLVS